MLDTGWNFLTLVNDLIKPISTLVYIASEIINQLVNIFVERHHDKGWNAFFSKIRDLFRMENEKNFLKNN